VVKSARVMKKAVEVLVPYLDSDKESGISKSKGRILLATVKGDVHDIGKNIVGVVLGCNNFDVIDMGVMVPADKLLERARKENVDIVGLSGLITPSLDEMVHVASEMERQEFTIPLLIGGATTSRLHTAIRIEPVYHGTTVHVRDASRSVKVASNLINTEKFTDYANDIKREYENIRQEYNRKRSAQKLISISEARQRKWPVDWNEYSPCPPKSFEVTVLDNYSIEELIPYIDWTPFFLAWDLHASYPRILEHKKYGKQAKELFNDANMQLKRIVDSQTLQAKAVFGLLPANASGDDIEIYTDNNRSKTIITIHHLRQQIKKPAGKYYECLTDFIAAKESGVEDYVGAFVVTVQSQTEMLNNNNSKNEDDYDCIMLRLLSDRLVEAFAERLHQRVRKEFWGYAEDENLTKEELLKEQYTGIRPAAGYPACPDHTEKQLLFDLLDVEKNIGVELTENFAMKPPSSISGWYFSHPESHYFALRQIDRDQVIDYAKRKGMSVEEIERWLSPNLSYSSSEKS